MTFYSLDMKVSFAVSGGGRLALDAIDNSSSLEVEPERVIVDTSVQPSVRKAFEARGVDVIAIRSELGPVSHQLSDIFERSDAGLWMLTFNRILPDSCLSTPERIVLNTHMSLLPSFRGLNALARAIEAGAKIAGASIHEVSSEVDGGRLVAQCAVPIIKDDSAESLGDRIWPHLREMYLLCIREASGLAGLDTIYNDSRSSIGHSGGAFGQILEG